MNIRTHSLLTAMLAMEMAPEGDRAVLRRSMERSLGLPPTLEEKVQEKVATRRAKPLSGHCPACKGTLAKDSPCMRRSYPDFNKQRRYR